MRRICVALVVGGLSAACGSGTAEQPADDLPTESTIMQVVYERSGGFAGLSRTLTLTASSLTEQQRGELEQLVADADFFELPAEIATDETVADDFTYSIRLDADDRSWTVVTSDAAMPDRLRPLVEWLDRASRQ